MMKIIMLGTGSGKPALTRNVSAVAALRDGEWLLFDCGEGTQMQIMRAGLPPGRLAAVFITHLHGDHFNGLAGLLATLGLDRREQSLTVVGPPGLREYMDTLTRLRVLFISYPLELREIGAENFRKAHAEPDRPLCVYQTADYAVCARPLDHRVFCLGYRMEESPRPGRFDVARARALGIPEGPLFGQLQSGQRVGLPDGRVIDPSEVLGPPRAGKAVAYCTDTRPCAAAVALAQAADLLIHEATFAEDRLAEAHAYGHSTAAQAARVARDGRARQLLITHISPRYTDAGLLLTEARAVFPETQLAEDLMEWPLS